MTINTLGAVIVTLALGSQPGCNNDKVNITPVIIPDSVRPKIPAGAKDQLEQSRARMAIRSRLIAADRFPSFATCKDVHTAAFAGKLSTAPDAIRAKVIISTPGKVTGFAVLTESLKGSETAACVEKFVDGMAFPSYDGQPIEAQISFQLLPKPEIPEQVQKPTQRVIMRKLSPPSQKKGAP